MRARPETNDSQGPGERSPPEAGFTILEALVAATVLAVAACATAALMVHGITLGAVNKETERAREAARQVLERISGVPVREVYAGLSDVEGSKAPPSPEVQGKLAEAVDVGATLQAEVIFPAVAGVLREDIQDPELGMPRDLNGDGVIDDANHADDCSILPLRIRLRWQGVAGEREFTMCAVLLDE